MFHTSLSLSLSLFLGALHDASAKFAQSDLISICFSIIPSFRGGWTQFVQKIFLNGKTDANREKVCDERSRCRFVAPSPHTTSLLLLLYCISIMFLIRTPLLCFSFRRANRIILYARPNT